MSRISRRDALKVGAALSGALAVSRLTPGLTSSEPLPATGSPNIVVLVFDALSAENLSLYGYRRETSPNLERFANRATVYNAHYSAGSFTTPGTASLLTGLYPWTHRAIDESGLIARRVVEDNLFRAIGKSYYRLAYSQNMWPNYFFGQFQADLDKVLSPAAFSLVDQIIGDKFGGDLVDAHRAFDDFLFQDGAPPASLVFGLAERIQLRRAVARAPASDYPRGLPRTGNYPIYFRLKDVFDGLMGTIEALKGPSLAYLHLWAPHAPYRASGRFDSAFADGWRPKEKPDHLLGDHIPPRNVNDRRQNYDEYVADIDSELGRLTDFLDQRGLLESTYLVITADHGEFFERGVEGHITPLLYDPVVRVPLLISSPGQTARRDINTPTSSLDLLPSLVQLTGGSVPAWCEGQTLTGLGGAEDPERSVYMMDAKENSAFAALAKASFALRKGQFKLICYRGFGQYGGRDQFELYDVQNDPAELNDVYSETSSTAKALREELLTKVQSVSSKIAT